MNDAPRNAGTGPEPQSGDFSSDQAIENAALAGAAAVQRLVAERNNLRNRLAAQQREAAALRAFNEELRRRLMLIHQRYVEVAKRVVGQLEQFDGTLREVIQEGPSQAGQGAPARQEEPAASPASLAQRLAETEMPVTVEDLDATEQASS